MKKSKLIIITVFLIVVAAMLLAGCDPYEIEMIKMKPHQSELALSEFDLTHFSIIVVYENDETEEISLDKGMFDLTDYEILSTKGTHSVIVRYKGNFTVFTIILT